MIAALDNGGVASLTAVPARRFDVIRRLTTRVAEVKYLEADVWGSAPVALSEQEADCWRAWPAVAPRPSHRRAQRAPPRAQRPVIDLV